HRRARQCAPTDAQRGPVGDECGRLLERHHLLAQAAIALSGAAAKFVVSERQQSLSKPATALNSTISSSQVGGARRSLAQKPWARRFSKASSGTPCCSTQV